MLNGALGPILTPDGTVQERTASAQHASSPTSMQSNATQRVQQRSSRQPADLPQHAERHQELKDVQRCAMQQCGRQRNIASVIPLV